MQILLILMMTLVILMSGCKKEEVSDLIWSQDMGYNWEVLLGCAESDVFHKLETMGLEVRQDPKYTTEDVTIVSYNAVDTAYGQETFLQLMFMKEENDSERQLVQIEETLCLTDWPDKNTAESITQWYEALVDENGEPIQQSASFPELTDIMRERDSEYAAWYNWGETRSFNMAFIPDSSNKVRVSVYHSLSSET